MRKLGTAAVAMTTAKAAYGRADFVTVTER